MNGLLLRRLTLAALVSENTTRKWLNDPANVRPATDERLRRAARSLHLKVRWTASVSTGSPSMGGGA